MNTGCFKCDKAQWDADGCTCEITGRLVGNVAKGCEYRKDIELKPCPFCGSKAVKIVYWDEEEQNEKAWEHDAIQDEEHFLCVKCYDCNIQFFGGVPISGEELIKAWNRRGGVDEKKLSCHFEHCKDCLSLIKRRIPDTEVVFEIKCGRKHKGIILKGEQLLSFGDITPEDFDKAEEESK